MTKKLNIDEVRAIINSYPALYHPGSYSETDPSGDQCVSKAGLIKRFEEALHEHYANEKRHTAGEDMA